MDQPNADEALVMNGFHGGDGIDHERALHRRSVGGHVPVWSLGVIIAACTITLCVVLCVAIVLGRDGMMPSALGVDTARGVFAEARSWAFLKALTDLGPHATNTTGGSQAAKLIRDAIDQINKDTMGSSQAFLEQQTQLSATGNIQNVLVRLHGGSSVPKIGTFVVSAHYDSVTTGPGATDDGSGVAVMVETARNLLDAARNPTSRLLLDQWGVLFVFFDGEERGSLGARIIDQHAWFECLTGDRAPASKCPDAISHKKVLVNMEGSGSSGRAVLLRTSSTWAATMFATSAAHPYGFSLTQFIYNKVFLNGYTDVDTLLKFNFHAIELLPLDSRYNYHSIDDSIDNVEPGALQHEGDNLSSFMRVVLSTAVASVPANPDVIMAPALGRAYAVDQLHYNSFLGVSMFTASDAYHANFTVAIFALAIMLAAFITVHRSMEPFRACAVSVGFGGLSRCWSFVPQTMACLLFVSVVGGLVVGKTQGPTLNWPQPWRTGERWISHHVLRVAVYQWVTIAVWLSIDYLVRQRRLPSTMCICCSKAIEKVRCFHIGYEDAESILALFLTHLVLSMVAVFVAPLAELAFLSRVTIACVIAVAALDVAYIASSRLDYTNDNLVALSWSVYVLRCALLLVIPLMIALDIIVFCTAKLPYYIDEMGIGWANGAITALLFCLYILPLISTVSHRLPNSRAIPATAVVIAAALSIACLTVELGPCHGNRC